MTKQAVLHWGIIGPGSISKTFAANLAQMDSAKLVAIGTRNPGKTGLAEGFPGARIHDGYEALINDPEVQAIYIGTPHSAHAEWSIRASQAGKHVLCEKPIAVSAHETDAMILAARKAGTFLGEAFMYRHHPVTAKLIELIRAGVLGEIRGIKASFGFLMGNRDPAHRLLANHTAGGGILDICGYPVSMVRLIAGVAVGKPFLDPVRVMGAAHIGDETNVDEWASGILVFPGDVIAEVAGGISLANENTVRVLGTKGWLEVMSPWFATGRQGGTTEIIIHHADGRNETITVNEPKWLYTFEIADVARAVAEGRQEFASPGMSWADSLGNMKVLDKWRQAVRLEYEFESAGRKTTISGQPLARRKTMRMRKLPGIAKEASVICLGGANFESLPQAEIICDAFYEAGGNVLDSAWLYGGGKCDTLFGAWMANRGVRDEMILIGKGAHSPLVYPDVIARQLTESLDRLQTDFIDVYFMHRDNPSIPVGEFVDAMDAEVSKGRIGIYGGSNWTRERMDAAFDYAAKNGKRAPGALSNNFSLAEMVNPVWGGVLAGADDAWKAWLRKRQIPDFAWSSQARGFFTDRAAPDKLDDPELVNAWYSPGNFARRDRAIEFAKKIGKKPLHVALAYCLWQDFPVVPLIGPLALSELEDSLEALDITLTPQDLKWLETGQ